MTPTIPPAEIAPEPAVTHGRDDYRDLFENAPVAYHEIDAQGIVRRVNREECRLLGFTPEEMVGQPVWTFVAGGEITVSKAAVVRKLSGEQPLTPFRREYRTRDRGLLTVEVHERLIRGAEGENVGIRTTLLDVTDQVAAEAALRDSQQWLTAILDALGDAVIAVDPLGSIRFLNPAAEAIIGRPESQLKGRDIEEVLRVSELRSSVMDAPLGQHLGAAIVRPWFGEITVITGGNRTLECAIKASPIVTAENRVSGVALILRESGSREQAA